LTDHLVIPDCHADPNYSNERFTWIGNIAIDRRPQVIVCLGDFTDMNSLCSYDKGKKDFEGRRYKNDIACARDALTRINKPIDDFNEQQRKNKKALYKPHKVMLLGNHEHRIDRVVQYQPELDGTLSVDDLCYQEFGWEVHPYTKLVCIDGIWYVHCLMTRNGQPVSGDNLGASLLHKQHVSTTVGHSHFLDYSRRALPDGKAIHGLSAGCFIDYDPPYADGSSNSWWRGLVYKHNVDAGDYDLELINMKKVRQIYG